MVAEMESRREDENNVGYWDSWDVWRARRSASPSRSSPCRSSHCARPNSRSHSGTPPPSPRNSSTSQIVRSLGSLLVMFGYAHPVYRAHAPSLNLTRPTQVLRPHRASKPHQTPNLQRAPALLSRLPRLPRPDPLLRPRRAYLPLPYHPHAHRLTPPHSRIPISARSSAR